MSAVTFEADPKQYLENEGYLFVRKLPTGEFAGVMPMLFTTGLFLGLDATGYRTRFCYGKPYEAAEALHLWDGNGFPPGYWIVQKPEDIQGSGSKEKKDAVQNR